jgi:fructose-1,6-bisphosphatase I
MFKKIMTLTRHIHEQHVLHPESTGALSTLLYQINVATKIISSHVNKAGLAKILGVSGRVNVQGEEVQKLDEFANFVLINALDHTGHVAGIATEEEADYLPITRQHKGGSYIIKLDPLDGSSNIDANVSIGTIFAFHRRVTPEGELPTHDDFLQPGKKLVCAGYIIYGSSTMLVYSTGHGVYGFTLDPEVGEFILSHEEIKIPDRCKCLSINESYEARWHEWTKRYMAFFKEKGGFDGKVTSRYIGSLVADFHRNLLYGGVFLYPADKKTPKGKLRLLYEAQPLGFLAKCAGGYASTGEEAILEMQPTELHQRCPLIIGNKREVEEAENYVQKYGY